jgi:hypothetical protein
MPPEIWGKIAEHGVIGLLLVAACIVIYRIYLALDASQKARIEDAKAHNAQLVDLIKNCTAAITSDTAASQASKEAFSEMRNAYNEHVEEARRAASTGRR